MTGLRLHDPRIDPSDPADAGAMVLGGARAQTPDCLAQRTASCCAAGAEDGQLHAAPPLAEEPPLGTWGTPPLGRAGTLALWPGGIVHSVPKHKGAGRRVSIAFNVGITMRPAPAVGASEEECGNMLSGTRSACRSRRLFPSQKPPVPSALPASLSILSSCVQSLRAETVLGRTVLTTLLPHVPQR